MPKSTVIYRCTKCDSQFPKWEGRCRECGNWDTLVEEQKTTIKATRPTSGAIVDLSDVASLGAETRLSSGFTEFDRVLGGGFVPGSLILLGGDPGIGKSTLLLQVTLKIASTAPSPILYVSGEESAEQIKHRVDRLGALPKNFKFLGDSSVETIMGAVDELRPSLVIVDSLQTVRSNGASAVAKPSELKIATEQLMTLAKQTKTPIVMIGHVTKDGAVAGPKVLEHLVDAVLYFEQGGGGPYRILRAAKNRFGGLSEIGVWHMTDGGLQEVANPSATFLGDRKKAEPGSAVAAILEGSRVFLVEIQALVTKTRFGYPQRRATGFDLNRLQLLIAVLSKRAGLPLSYYDVHLNVVGGLKVNEPGSDLPVALAIASALKNTAIQHDLVAVGEIGLQGEIRGVGEIERRLEEASRLGFKEAIVPPSAGEISIKKLHVSGADTITEAITITLTK